MQKKTESEFLSLMHAIRPEITPDEEQFLATHPELRQILADYFTKILEIRPMNLTKFTKFYFRYFDAPASHPVRPIVVTAPSGCGKGTLIARLLKEYPHIFSQSVSDTTRQPRTGEVAGYKYNFTTRPKFEE